MRLDALQVSNRTLGVPVVIAACKRIYHSRDGKP